MTDRPALADALREGEQALAADPRGHLPLARRQAIWAALGDGVEGRRARARLSIDSARHELPIWERLWPRNRLPHHLLDLAEQVSRGDLDGRTLTPLRDQANTELDDISWASSNKSAVGVGYAAHRALAAAIRDEAFDAGRLDAAPRDEDLEPHQRDSAYLASVAAAGGPPWDPESSTDRRRDYWHWWLTEAVPAAARVP